jgi:hypothetical protein
MRRELRPARRCTSGKSFPFRATYNYKRLKIYRRVYRATGSTSSNAVSATTWTCSSSGHSNTSRPLGTWSTGRSCGTFVGRNRPAIHRCKWSTCCSDTPSSAPSDPPGPASPRFWSAAVSYWCGTQSANPGKSRPCSLACLRRASPRSKPPGTI